MIVAVRGLSKPDVALTGIRSTYENRTVSGIATPDLASKKLNFADEHDD